MDGIGKPKDHCNDDLVEELFRLLFQTVWIPRHDSRYSGVYEGFRKTAVSLSNELIRTGLSSMDRQCLRRIGVWIGMLSDDIATMGAAKVITGRQQAEAEALLRRIAEAVKTAELPAGEDVPG